MTTMFHRLSLGFMTLSLALITTSVVAQCSISDLIIEQSDCDEDNSFSIDLDFNFENVGGLGFQVLGNGVNYGTFAYADLPQSIVGLQGDCITNFEFIVRDIQDPTCSTFVDYGTVCCDAECSLELFDVAVSECMENNTFNIDFNIESIDIGESTTFSVFLNGVLFSELSYDVLPFSLSGISSDEIGNNTFTVCDSGDTDCCDTYIFLNPCECAMTNVTADIVECDIIDSTYFVFIDFDHVSTTDSFQMGYSNNFLGVFAYADLPVLAGPIEMSEDETEILIVDKNDVFCLSSAFVGVVNDCNIECQIFNLFAESFDCGDGEYFIDLEFDTEDIEGSTFDVFVDDIQYGSFPYGENFYTVGPIVQNCTSPPLVEVQDSEILFCKDFFNFDEPICCGGLDCEFTEFVTEVECNDEDGVVIFAQYANNGVETGDQFFIDFEGETFGPYPPFEGSAIFNVPTLQNGEYQITIFVAGNEDCNATTEVSVDCVPSDNCTISDVFPVVNECEDDMVSIDIEFNYAGSVSDSFMIVGNGVNYGTFAYGNGSYPLGFIEADCTTLYEFIVIDQVNEDCSGVFEFETPLCCDEECMISNIEIFDVVCENDNVIFFVLDFDHTNTGSSFEVVIDGVVIGTFNYENLPIELSTDFPPNFTIDIIDTDTDGCSFSMFYESECMSISDCVLDEGEFTLDECDDEFYSLSFDMFHESNSDSFNISFLNDQITFAYTDLPVIVSGLPLGEVIDFEISDQVDPECRIFRSFELVVCETSVFEIESKIDIFQTMNSLEVTNNSDSDLGILLYDLTGKLLLRNSVSPSNMLTIDKMELQNGIYLLNISGKKTTISYKIPIVH